MFGADSTVYVWILCRTYTFVQYLHLQLKIQTFYCSIGFSRASLSFFKWKFELFLIILNP